MIIWQGYIQKQHRTQWAKNVPKSVTYQFALLKKSHFITFLA